MAKKEIDLDFKSEENKAPNEKETSMIDEVLVGDDENKGMK